MRPVLARLVVRSALLSALAAFLFCSQAAAQAAQGQDDVAALEARLKGLREEIAIERAALSQARQGWEAERTRLERERQTLAQDVIARESHVEALLRRLNRSTESVTVAEQDARTNAAAWESLRARARTAAEGLAISLAELPVSAVEPEELRALAAALGGTSPFGAGVSSADGTVSRVMEAHDRAHAEGLSTHLRDTTTWSAQGKLERVALLSVGHVGFAYETEDGRAGLAVRQDQAASGYRWSEALGVEQRQAVRDAIATLRGGAAAIRFPVDLTGRMGDPRMQRTEAFWEQVVSGGAVMFPLGAVALAALLLSLERTWWLYARNRLSTRRVEHALRDLTLGEWSAAEGRLARGRGAAERVLAAALRRAGQGRQAAEDGAQEQMLVEWPRLERGLGGLALLAGIAPLLGLLGTVTGIMHTFGVIRSLGNATPELMAGGISEALVTTAAGLIIAIPILLLHSLFRGRAERVMAEAERSAAVMLGRLNPAGSSVERAT